MVSGDSDFSTIRYCRKSSTRVLRLLVSAVFIKQLYQNPCKGRKSVNLRPYYYLIFIASSGSILLIHSLSNSLKQTHLILFANSSFFLRLIILSICDCLKLAPVITKFILCGKSQYFLNFELRLPTTPCIVYVLNTSTAKFS